MSSNTLIPVVSQEAEALKELHQLYKACKTINFQLVRKLSHKLKKRNVRFELKVGRCTTTLHWMCMEGNIDEVKLLVEMYGNVEARDENVCTPLHFAAGQGHNKVVQYLACEQNCNTQPKNRDGQAPFQLARRQGHFDIMELLRLKRDNPDLEDEEETMLFFQVMELYIIYEACKGRCYQLAMQLTQLLSMTKLNFHLSDTNRSTTLHLMSFSGNLNMVKLLVEMYGNLDARDENLCTPLHLACKQGHIEVVKYLTRENMCNLEARDAKGETPLHKACATGYIHVVKHLIGHHKCNPQAKGKDDWSCLHYACAYGHIDIVRYLIHQCENSPEIADQNGYTPLHLACLRRRNFVIRYLVNECGCNPLVKSNREETALQISFEKCDSSIIQCLLSRCEGSPDLKNMMLSPLDLACIYGHFEVVIELINRRSYDPDSVNSVDGISPIYYAYRFGHLNIIKYCIKTNRHNPNTYKIRRELPHAVLSISILYSVCSEEGHLGIVKFLVNECGVDPRECGATYTVYDKKTHQDSQLKPRRELQMALSSHEHLQVYRSLHGSNSITSDIVQTRAFQQFTSSNKGVSIMKTPLEVACSNGYLDILKVFARKFDLCPDTVHMLIEIAGRYGHLEIMKYLLTLQNIDPNCVEDNLGNTLLHNAVLLRSDEEDAYEIAKYLCRECNIDLDRQNCLRDTPLHVACEVNYCRIIKLLLSNGCNPNITNMAGKTALWTTKCSDIFKVFMRHTPAGVFERILSDDIKEAQRFELLECLIKQCNWNPNEKTNDGENAMHLACKADKHDAVKYLLSLEDKTVDLSAKNRYGQTPIELTSSTDIIKELLTHGANPINVLANVVVNEEKILQLVKEMNKNQLNGITSDGNTALHLACAADRCSVVEYLLQEPEININVNAKNDSEFSPIQLTKNSAVIRELIRYGANPTELYVYCRRVLRESQLLETTVKVFIVGDNDAGKSTLAVSLQREGWLQLLLKASNPQKTDTGSGIIAYDFKSKHCGQITLYDYVGGRLFHESQSDLLKETACSPRVFLIVTDFSGGDEKLTMSIQYWLDFLENMPKSELNQQLIVIGSKADLCWSDVKRKESIVNMLLRERVLDLPSVTYCGFTALDCRYPSSGRGIRSCLTRACGVARNPNMLAFNAHCFQVYLVESFKEMAVVMVCDILKKIEEDTKHMLENDPLFFLPYDSLIELLKLCNELHDKSQIVFLKDSKCIERSWIVVDKATLMSQVFKSEMFKQLHQIPSSTGLLPLSKITALRPLKVYNPHMFIKFLTHLEFCKEVTDKEIQAFQLHSLLCSERLYFFPTLINIDAPQDTWKEFHQFDYYCGWVLQCIRPEQFFTSQLFRVLILRLMFASPDNLNVHSPVKFKCSVWKNGISWGNVIGVESLVELQPDNKAVIFLMRCRKANLAECVKHRSQTIRCIRQCAQEFCAKVETSESFMHPFLTMSYPISTISNSYLFDMRSIALVVATKSMLTPFVLSQTGKTISLHELLLFEPYAELPTSIIQELCNRNNPRYVACLTNNFLVRFTEQVHKNPLLMEMITVILKSTGVLETNTNNLLVKLVEWRDKCDVTYKQLQKDIDQFSIFAGSSILVCAAQQALIL